MIDAFCFGTSGRAVPVGEAASPAKFAALSLLASSATRGGGELRARVGNPIKHPANPLFGQDQPWETRIDNGYPNVVPPNRDNPSYQIWYGNQAANGTRNRYSLLYANSTDGLRWHKPSLGLFDFGAAGFPNFAHLGSANNVVVEGDGIGVYYDPHEADPSRRYKALGDACWLSPTLSEYGEGVWACQNLYESPPQPVPPYKRPQFYGALASSPDGLAWPRNQVTNFSWPPPHKWDTHSNAFFDEVEQSYIVTTRSCPVETTGVERETSVTRSDGPRWEFNRSKQLAVTLKGDIDHQTYAQITFRWLDIFIGLSMVFDQDTGDEVHCRLAFASQPEGPWQPVEGDNIIDAPDFLPLGDSGEFDSHVIFAGARPFRHEDGSTWIYYMGGDGPHDGARKSSLGLATLRPDGWSYVSGPGTFTTPSLTVTAEMLTVTADFGADGGGALRFGVVPDGATEPPAELSLNNSVPLRSNKTDVAMRWLGHGRSPDLSSLLGKSVKLEVSLEGGAMLYAVGFAQRTLPATVETSI